ncbi:hypothetical protein [Rhodococcoides fascians]|uniref:hypothetical protein n=1 Tax=Rhodococcoides fascians TaxID=1828 RepID=UPI0012D362B3|nr:hypothetical protein [Rhodococcus fascians]
MLSRVKQIGPRLMIAVASLTVLSGCDGNSNGIQVQHLDTDNARQGLAQLQIVLPDGFEAEDVTRITSFTGKPAYTGRFDGPDATEVVAPEFNRLNPDTPIEEVPCRAVPWNGSWQKLGFVCTSDALLTQLRKPDGNNISIVLQPGVDGTTQLFVEVPGT